MSPRMLVAGHGSNLAERRAGRGSRRSRRIAAIHSASSMPIATRDRAPDRQAERLERERAEPVVGAHARQRLGAACGAAGSTPTASRRASSRRRPATRRRRAAAAGAPAASSASGDREHREGERGEHERAARPRPGSRRRAPDERADAHRAEDASPTPRRRRGRLGDDRPERAARAPQQVPERRGEHDAPHPRARPERAPAVLEVLEERASPRARDVRRQAQPRRGTRR